MPKIVVTPRMRGFLCTNAHPAGCAANVRRQTEQARGAGGGLGRVLVVGSSTGYGLSSLVTAMWGHGAKALGVCLERPADGNRTASAGWYNLAELHRLARDERRELRTINGDAFAHEVKAEVVEALRELGPVDLVVYSLASPRRKDPDSEQVWTSVLKTVGEPARAKHIEVRDDSVTTIEVEPATEEEIEATVKVRGGEDWELWIRLLLDERLLARGARTVAYSYVGPRVTHPIYRSGTIGHAKQHLEATAGRLHEALAGRLGGGAWVSVNKAAVTQAAVVIPAVPLYQSLLYKVMKLAGTHEEPLDQMLRLFRDHLGPGREPRTDAQHLIRLDDREMDPGIQSRVHELWTEVTTENLSELSDWPGFKREFRQLFGFDVESVDYDEAVEIDRPLV